MASKREGELKSLFAKELKRQLPNFLVLRYATNGAPDREVVGNGITTRWEGKHATPDFKSPGDQELMCNRLAATSHCLYVVWFETQFIRQTLIVHPREVVGRTSWNLVAEACWPGFDMKKLVDYVRKVHNL